VPWQARDVDWRSHLPELFLGREEGADCYMQRPFTQEPPGAQTLPHAPQLLESLKIFVSQPSAYLPLQSAKPELHVLIAQVPLLQTEVAFGAEQMLPQAPQLLVSKVSLVSQPLAYWPSQSANPLLQAPIAHTPPLHKAVPLATKHTLPHAPQLLGSLASFVSQPSTYLPSQSPKPGLHALIAQIPLLQNDVAFGAEQVIPQPPQLPSTLRLVSQPSAY
jgi:hypothetical protein